MLKRKLIAAGALCIWLALLAALTAWDISLASPQGHAADKKDTSDTKKEDANEEKRLADYTLWLVLLTGGIVGTGILQVVVLLRADETTKESVKFAGQVAGFAGLQTDLMEKQKEIARQEFLATHRPQLEVRFVREVSDGIEITVINTGTGAANFVAARAEIRHVNQFVPFPSPHDLVAESAFDLRSKFEPSASDRYTIPPDVNPGQAFEAGFGGPLHVFGWIVYETGGLNPIRRCTYFGRKVVPLQPELVPVEGSDWNFIQ